MPLPTDRLASLVDRLLRCAAPDALPSVSDIVSRAHQDGLSDDEVINMLCHRYNCGRDGWPLNPERRRVVRVEKFFINNAPQDIDKAPLLLKQKLSEEEILSELKQRYGRDELGEATKPSERVREKLIFLFKRAAPVKLAQIPQYVEAFLKRSGGDQPGADLQAVMRHYEPFIDDVCSELGVGRDGWPGHPIPRRRAKLTRFFLQNNPQDLRKVETLLYVDATEQEIMSELYELYGKDEFGNVVKKKTNVRERLETILKAADPAKLKDIDTFLTYQARNSLSDEAIVALIQSQYKVDSDGWPKERGEKRLRARLTRFFFNNAPSEMKKVDQLCNLPGVGEDEVMNQLFKRYGKDEFGVPIVSKERQDAFRDAVCEFYEQYVPEKEVLPLSDQAIALGLPEDQLFAVLEQRYAGIKPKQSELRQKVTKIFRRAAPEAVAQIPIVMLTKRSEDLSDADVIQGLCTKFQCNADGWPLDRHPRIKKRLKMFFGLNDHHRLAEVNHLLRNNQIQTDEEEKAFFEDLFEQYRKDELGEKWPPDLCEEFDEDEIAPSPGRATGGLLKGTVSEAAALLGQPFDEDDDATGRNRLGAALLASSGRTPQQLFNDPDHILQAADAVGGGFDVPLEQQPTSGFVPGMTQIWPPPEIDGIDALYRSELFEHLLRKYGAASGDCHDAFLPASSLPTTKESLMQEIRNAKSSFPTNAYLNPQDAHLLGVQEPTSLIAAPGAFGRLIRQYCSNAEEDDLYYPRGATAEDIKSKKGNASHRHQPTSPFIVPDTDGKVLRAGSPRKKLSQEASSWVRKILDNNDSSPQYSREAPPTQFLGSFATCSLREGRLPTRRDAVRGIAEGTQEVLAAIQRDGWEERERVRQAHKYYQELQQAEGSRYSAHPILRNDVTRNSPAAGAAAAGAKTPHIHTAADNHLFSPIPPQPSDLQHTINPGETSRNFLPKELKPVRQYAVKCNEHAMGPFPPRIYGDQSSRLQNVVQVPPQRQQTTIRVTSTFHHDADAHKFSTVPQPLSTHDHHGTPLWVEEEQKFDEKYPLARQRHEARHAIAAITPCGERPVYKKHVSHS